MEVLGLDIGGTNVRIALFKIDKRPVLKKKKVIPTSSVKNLAHVINAFDTKAERCCIGFAGPITGTTAKLTNADLTVSASKLKKETGLKEVTILNDWHAVGYGVKFLTQKDKYMLNEGVADPKNKVHMAIGPGTGLGKAYIVDGKVYPCEPGWTTIGIEDIDDYSLLDYLKTKYKRDAYWEDILSGRGIIDIYDHIEIKSDLEVNKKIGNLIQKEPENKAKLITKYSSQDKLSDMTLRIFAKFYARLIRDSVLTILTSKVYLAGGISIALKHYLKRAFGTEFLKHAKYTALLKRVEVVLVLNPDTGLIGAGAYAGGLY